MKNLLIYINPTDKRFSKEHDDLTKIQIENSLDQGWKAKDVLLITNFNYEYHGIKSIIVGNYTVFDQNRSTKIQAINELFRRDLISNTETYWFHDHDAFQLVPIELKLSKGKDAAFTTHGAFDPVMWNAGSFFFNSKSADIFKWIEEWMEKLGGTNEQSALTHMWKINYKGVNERCEMLDSSYNLGIYKVDENIKNSKPPIKVAHFHPHKPKHLELYTSKNLLPSSLLHIFANHGIAV